MARLPKSITVQLLIDAECRFCGGGQAYVEADVPLETEMKPATPEVIVRIPDHKVAVRVVCSSCQRLVNFDQQLTAIEKEDDDAAAT